MKANPIRQQVALAVRACEDKQAQDVAIIQMDKASSTFTDYFLICSGANSRQVQAIAESVESQLKSNGVFPNNVEGYKQAEWVLLDYVDFVVHVFVESARRFYDLERLWKSATRLTLAELEAKEVARPSKPAKVTAPASDIRARDTIERDIKDARSAAVLVTPKRLGAARKKPVAKVFAAGRKRAATADKKSSAAPPGKSKTRNPAKSRSPLSKMSAAAKSSKKTK